jgi:hypothetical protein
MLTAYVLFFLEMHAFLFHRQIKRSDFSDSARASGLITAFNAVLFMLLSSEAKENASIIPS